MYDFNGVKRVCRKSLDLNDVLVGNEVVKILREEAGKGWLLRWIFKRFMIDESIWIRFFNVRVLGMDGGLDCRLFF